MIVELSLGGASVQGERGYWGILLESVKDLAIVSLSQEIPCEPHACMGGLGLVTFLVPVYGLAGIDVE